MTTESTKEFVTKDDFRRVDKELLNQQSEIKEVSKTMAKIVATQEKMQGIFSHFSNDFNTIREDIQRIFDRRSDEIARAKPNYFAWIIGIATVMAITMSGILTFVSIMIEPMKDYDARITQSIEKISNQVYLNESDHDDVHMMLKEHIGVTKATEEAQQKEIDWLRNEVVLLIKK